VFEHRCWSSAEPYYGQQESWMQRLRAQGHRVVAIGKQHYRSAKDDTGFSEQILPMYLANDGKGWPQGLQRKPMAEFPDAEEMARLIGPGETSYTQYDRDITAAAVEWLQHGCYSFPLSARIFHCRHRNSFSICIVMLNYPRHTIATHRSACVTRSSIRCASSGITPIISTQYPRSRVYATITACAVFSTIISARCWTRCRTRVWRTAPRRFTPAITAI
jgi:hypothetical protein